MSHLLSATQLSDLIESGAPVRLLDVRWRLDRPEGHAEYLEGHLPGAVFVDLPHELADHDRPGEGRHPLPSGPALQAAARRWGLRTGDIVVAYDDSKGLSAARAWWLLRQAGVDARVLDGGIRAWIAAGHPLDEGGVIPPEGDVELGELGADAITIDEAAALPATGILLDVRAPERYRGESEPLDPVAGHIPGAVNLPVGTLLRRDGTIRDHEELRAELAALGVTGATPVAAYCGSGITAAQAALVLGELGISAKVFPGSWSQWSNTPGCPVAIGPHPADD